MPIVEANESTLDAAMSARLARRFLSAEGLFLDSHLSSHPHLIVPVEQMLDWFTNIEEISAQPLGRRLAHAAADHETWRQMNRPTKVPSGIFSKAKRIPWLMDDWQERGVGKLRTIEEGRVCVEQQVQTAMAGGQGAGAWEILQGSRFRFRWEQHDSGRTDIILESDAREAHPPRKMVASWQERKPQQTETGFPKVDKNDAGWEFEGRRCFLMARDLILRLEDEMLPHVEVRFDDELIRFGGLEDESREVVWNILARAEQRSFINQGEHVIVAEKSHWQMAVEAMVGRRGHGGLESLDYIDNNGGVEFIFKTVFHPALLLGRLMGCWQRANGRQPRGEWSSTASGCKILILARHEIA